MNKDLIERYVYAVTRQLPHRLRRDVAAELKSLVEDMLEARCGESAPTDQDLRVVLAELGTPNELAESYSPDGARALIGPPYFSQYKLVLKIVLLCVAGGITVAQVVLGLTGTQALPWFLWIWNWVGMLFTGAMGAFSFVTLLFALFQWKNVQLDTAGDVTGLPLPPQANERIPQWEPVAGLLISALFAVVFLAFPQIIGVWMPREARMVPLFSPDFLRSRWLLVLLIGFLSILYHAAALLEGRYTRRLGVLNLAANLASVPLFILLLGVPGAANPEFPAAMQQLLASPAAASFAGNIPWLFLALVLFALALDSITTLVKSFRKAP